MEESDSDRLARRLEERAARLAERRAPESSLGEIIETASRRLMTAIVAAGALIAIGLYSTRSEGPRFDAFATPDGKIVRVNMESGTVLACEGRTCMTVVQRGQHLQRTLESLEAQPPPPAQRALPTPAPARPAALPAPEPATDEAPSEE